MRHPLRSEAETMKRLTLIAFALLLAALTRPCEAG
jgi:hypothetical protein